jgi:hypothetical protein
MTHQPLCFLIDAPTQVRTIPMPPALYAEVQEMARLCLLCGAPAQALYGIRETTVSRLLGLDLPAAVRQRFTSSQLLYNFGGCATCVGEASWIRDALTRLSTLLTSGEPALGRLTLGQFG